MVGSFRALTIQSGVTKQVQDTQTLVVGNAIDVGTGALQIGATASGLTLTPATTVSGALTASTGVTVTTGGLTVSAGVSALSGGLTVTGTTTFSSLATAGVLHVNGSGVASTSLVVDADVSATAAIAVSKLAAGSAGQLLINNATPTPTWTTVSQDAIISATGVVTVTGIQGKPLSSSLATIGAGQDGYVLAWDNTDGYWKAESASSSLTVTLSGDVTGPSNSNTVAKINGTSVVANPADATFLISQGSNASQWHALSQDATSTDQGVVTVVSAHGAFSTGGALTVTTGGANITGTTAVTGNITATTSIAATTSLSAGTTITAGTGLTVTTGGASITGGTTTDTLNTTGLATLNSASVTTTLGVTGVSTLTGGVKTNAIDAITGVALVIGGATASTVQIGKSGSLTEVLGDFKVDGAETILGASTFQNPVTFDGNVTIADGYNFTMVDTTAGAFTVNAKNASALTTLSGAALTVTSGAAATWGTSAGALTLNGFAGINVQAAGTTYLDVGVTTPNVVGVPSGITLEATGSGQIIANSATTLTVPFTTTGVSTGAAVYVSANDTVLAADSAAISTSYCAGFVTAAGFVALDGLVTPILSGSASAGQVMYLDTGANAGKVTATAPSSGVVAPVGFMKNATQMVIRVLSPVQL